MFCDSEFWHGYDWASRKNDIKSKREFWIPKIEKNIERDIHVNDALVSDGWVVIRFWGNDILKCTDECVADVIRVVGENYDIRIGRVFRLQEMDCGEDRKRKHMGAG